MKRIFLTVDDHLTEISTLEKGCWVCVRPSGTEPKIKLYVNTNAPDKAAAEALNRELGEASKALLNG